MKRLMCVVLMNLCCVSWVAAEYRLHVVLPEHEVVLSQDDILALPQTQIVTGTPWTESVDEFTGIALSTLVDAIGWDISAKDTQVVLVALNDYQISANLDTLLNADAMLSHTRNAELMPVRAYGPFWLMFPFDERPELNDRLHRGWSVWQLQRIELQHVTAAAEPQK
ncbi:hypothetical protein ACFOSD_02880 [Salinispirillum marinum]|uniref:Oxidoreductase molybdopterin-binding domain-containing protein n=2 Tax=Saccharospirillaceae TaxID=255527 RepID=A0ABV8BAD9_9GAMM